MIRLMTKYKMKNRRTKSKALILATKIKIEQNKCMESERERGWEEICTRKKSVCSHNWNSYFFILLWVCTCSVSNLCISQPYIQPFMSLHVNDFVIKLRSNTQQTHPCHYITIMCLYVFQIFQLIASMFKAV